MAAPITAIVGHDLAFYEQLPKVFPHHPNAKGNVRRHDSSKIFDRSPRFEFGSVCTLL
jgi:hypothetical protein